jgi:hypothetical protein
MNVFILSTGRCGSTTFVKAASHITNFTSAHESRMGILGPQRLVYPENHIESDNRLCWFLGRLDKSYGDKAFYVHLKRDRAKTAASYAMRYKPGLIMHAYARGIYSGLPPNTRVKDVALDYYDTVSENIAMFLKSKTHKMEFSLEKAKQDWHIFWEFIGAQGDLIKSTNEWDIAYNKAVN